MYRAYQKYLEYVTELRSPVADVVNALARHRDPVADDGKSIRFGVPRRRCYRRRETSSIERDLPSPSALLAPPSLIRFAT